MVWSGVVVHFRVAWYGVMVEPWHGMVWCGVIVQYGVVVERWHGMVWSGVECSLHFASLALA
jgi:hypothetical protein